MTFLQSSVFNKQILKKAEPQIWKKSLKSSWSRNVGQPLWPLVTHPLLEHFHWGECTFSERFPFIDHQVAIKYFLSLFPSHLFWFWSKDNPSSKQWPSSAWRKSSLFSNFWASQHLMWVMIQILQVQRRRSIESRHSEMCPGRLFWERVLELPMKSNLASGLWREGKTLILRFHYICNTFLPASNPVA